MLYAYNRAYSMKLLKYMQATERCLIDSNIVHFCYYLYNYVCDLLN